MPTKVKLTREALAEAMKPPNNCAVKRFMEALDEDSKRVLEEAFSYDPKDLTATNLREFLIGSGFPESDVPGVDSLKDHRVGRRPCRCRD